MKHIALAACTAAVFATNVAAQEGAGDETLAEVVVIGTPGGAGVDRREASFAVTTIEPDQMAQLNPQSTADLLKSIPGVWVESSGGIAGANIDVRGLPGGSDAPFVTFAINGSPLYGTEMLSFFGSRRYSASTRRSPALRACAAARTPCSAKASRASR